MSTTVTPSHALALPMSMMTTSVDKGISTSTLPLPLPLPHMRMHMQRAVEGCLFTACATLGFDVAELWAEAQGVKHCVCVYSSPATIQTLSTKLEDIYHGEDNVHDLSPKLIDEAAAAREPLWRAMEPPCAPLHRCCTQLATAIVTCYEALEFNTYVAMVCFSIKHKQRSDVKTRFLTELTKAAAIACLEFCENLEQLVSEPSSTSKSWCKDIDEVKDAQVPTEGKLESKSGMEDADDFSLAWTSFPPIISVRSNMAWSDFKHVEHLTDGSTAEVFTAFMGDMPVVIKLLKTECMTSSVAINDFQQERECLLRISHPNIMKLYGYGTDPRPFLVLERLDGGSIGQMLGMAKVRDRRKRFKTRKHLTYSQLLECAIDIASALEYLHERAVENGTVIHRDLKPDNIGVCASGAVKLMDFGLCRLVKRRTQDSQLYAMTGTTGSLRYMAPEVARAESYNETVDVYSFAIILWQIAKLQIPYQGMNTDEFMSKVVVGGARPNIPGDWPEDFAALLKDCWAQNPAARPPFHVVRARLQQFLAQVQREGRDAGIKRIANLIWHRGNGEGERHSSWF